MLDLVLDTKQGMVGNVKQQEHFSCPWAYGKETLVSSRREGRVLWEIVLEAKVTQESWLNIKDSLLEA